ncbi:MAG TPA: hypothetical protein V6D47_15430 [Oscillatoriaceae cyanobacterium]
MKPIDSSTTVPPLSKLGRTASEAPTPTSASNDQLRLTGADRGVRVEITTNYLLFKRKQVFSLMPQANGDLVFSQTDGSGKLLASRVVGSSSAPTRMSIDVDVDAPFASRRLRLDLAHDGDGSHLTVVDPVSGKVLRQADSNG